MKIIVGVDVVARDFTLICLIMRVGVRYVYAVFDI